MSAKSASGMKKIGKFVLFYVTVKAIFPLKLLSNLSVKYFNLSNVLLIGLWLGIWTFRCEWLLVGFDMKLNLLSWGATN